MSNWDPTPITRVSAAAVAHWHDEPVPPVVIRPEPRPGDRRPILRDGSRKEVRFKRDPTAKRFAPGMPLPSVGKAMRPKDPTSLLRRSAR